MKERFRYKKEMGQNFIFDLSLLEKLAEVSLVTHGDAVLEIGAGKGLFTAALARRSRKVVSVELDRTLLPGLRESLSLFSNVEILEGDILKMDLQGIFEKLQTPCRVAANIPYNITTPLIEKLLLSRLPFESIAVMVQKEVGDKLMAKAGQPEYGPLSIFAQFFTEPEEALRVPAECFTPAPKVDSRFMLLTKRKSPAVLVYSEAMLFNVVRIAFAMRRKTLANNLLRGNLELTRDRIEEILIVNHLSLTARAEQLSIQDFANLSNALYLRNA